MPTTSPLCRVSTLVLTLGALSTSCSSDAGSPSNPGGAGGMTAVAGNSGSPAVGGGGISAAGASGSGSGQGGLLGGSGGNSGGAGGVGGTPGDAGGTAGVGGTGGSAGGGGVGGTAGGSGGVNNAPFELKSSAFEEGDEVPLKHKCAEVNPVGQNISPPLSWGPGPAGTLSYAIVMEHVPNPEHWVIWDIPANVTSLPENVEHAASPPVPAGSKQSLVDLDGFQGSGYLGPCPQAVNSRQSYRFTLYAIDVATLPGLSATSNPTAAANVVKQHLVAGSQGKTLTGTQIRTN